MSPLATQEPVTSQHRRSALPIVTSAADQLELNVLRVAWPKLQAGWAAGSGNAVKSEKPILQSASMVVLFRLLYILHAEARRLMPMEHGAYRIVSLTSLCRTLVDRGLRNSSRPGATASFGLRQRLLNLFCLIRDGHARCGVAPYPGWLFGRVDTAQTSTHWTRASAIADRLEVEDSHLLAALVSLIRQGNSSDADSAPIPYDQMPVRHLGSLYEHLIDGLQDQHTRTRAGRAAERCHSRRKRSGSYYTPEPIVRYMVQHTLGPALRRKLRMASDHSAVGSMTPAEVLDDLLDFTVLDPAMGSGHFLIEATRYIVAQLHRHLKRRHPVALQHLRQQFAEMLMARCGTAAQERWAELTDTQLLARSVLKRCIFGVDLDPMAAEIARMSLWLAHGQPGLPACVLHHHLRWGDSLLGMAPQHKLPAAIAPSTVRAAKLRAAVGRSLDLDSRQVRKSLEWEAQSSVLNAPALCLLDQALVARLDRRTASHKTAASANPSEERHPHFHWNLEFAGIFRTTRVSDPESAGFDAVIGNPPYSGHRQNLDARPLKKLFEVCAHHANLATAFCERSIQCVRPKGAFGLIIPKSIQYVQAWKDARKLLSVSNRLDLLIDVSQAFDDVLLEQAICIGQKRAGGRSYRPGSMTNRGIRTGPPIALSLASRLDRLPAFVDRRSIALLGKISQLGPQLGEISQTSQALGYQAHVISQRAGEEHDVPIYRGRHIRTLCVEPTHDYIARSHLLAADRASLAPKVQQMLGPKVVTQNIVAHIAQPQPRIWIISAPDPNGILCLNTISTTLIRDARFPINYIATILNSSLANWFYYEFSFCRAVRTMHFDQHYAAPLPIAVPSNHDVAACDHLVATSASFPTRSARQQSIDHIVFAVYRLSAQERSFIHDYCYGSAGLRAISN